MPAPSLRELARSLGLSHTTVSEALRDSPRVRPETRKRVLAAARAAGYKHNPLAGALMSEIRRSRAGTFRGVVALLDLDDPDARPKHVHRFHAELSRGARERASELGFKLEPFVIGQRGLTEQRLDTILQSRGIRGVLLLPANNPPDMLGLDWSKYAAIYADYVIERPPLHTVCADHFRSMMTALVRLQRLGYRRPGLVLEQHHDERLLFRWEAAFRAFHEHHDEVEHLKPHIVPAINRETFVPWFKKAKPDVVMCHRSDVVEWMTAAGAEVPKTHGFCCLNVVMSNIPAAGLDLQPRALGARGVEMLIGQLLRNEYGIPDPPSSTSIPAVWVDGPTLRQQGEVPATPADASVV
ncbi:MAG: LacI family DNA-binding transcriptional regulator [Opitutaceae bacterium]|nr:LacI family DNA-binding transcriptional regulator [Opitutaceae bacterium]